MLVKEQCISVTDLKSRANSLLKNLSKPKYIFVNNKPIAVLIDIDQLGKYNSEWELIEEFDFGPEGMEPWKLLDEYYKRYGR